MRVGHLQVTRPEWYDRGPLPVALVYAATIAPAGTTVRWSYTVPSGRKAYLELGQVGSIRSTAAAPNSRIAASLRYTPSGGAVGSIVQSLFDDNTIGARDSALVGNSMLLFPGDTLDATTSDISTGGTVSFRLLAKLTEFDA